MPAPIEPPPPVVHWPPPGPPAGMRGSSCQAAPPFRSSASPSSRTNAAGAKAGSLIETASIPASARSPASRCAAARLNPCNTPRRHRGSADRMRDVGRGRASQAEVSPRALPPARRHIHEPNVPEDDPSLVTSEAGASWGRQAKNALERKIHAAIPWRLRDGYVPFLFACQE